MTKIFNLITREKDKWLIEIQEGAEDQALVNAYCNYIACYSMINFYPDGSIQINPQLDWYVIQLLEVSRRELIDEKIAEIECSGALIMNANQALAAKLELILKNVKGKEERLTEEQINIIDDAIDIMFHGNDYDLKLLVELERIVGILSQDY